MFFLFLFYVCYLTLKGKEQQPLHGIGEDLSLAVLSHGSVTSYTKPNKDPCPPPLSVAACQCHAANRLCALHFVPATSYGKVHWDYVQNALRSAGAYTSQHKSDSHWEGCNTTPAEPDKPSILPFIQPLLFPCVISHHPKKGKKSLRKKSCEQMEIQQQFMLIFMYLILYGLHAVCTAGCAATYSSLNVEWWNLMSIP